MKKRLNLLILPLLSSFLELLHCIFGRLVRTKNNMPKSTRKNKIFSTTFTYQTSTSSEKETISTVPKHTSSVIKEKPGVQITDNETATNLSPSEEVEKLPLSTNTDEYTSKATEENMPRENETTNVSITVTIQTNISLTDKNIKKIQATGIKEKITQSILDTSKIYKSGVITTSETIKNTAKLMKTESSKISDKDETLVDTEELKNVSEVLGNTSMVTNSFTMIVENTRALTKQHTRATMKTKKSKQSELTSASGLESTTEVLGSTIKSEKEALQTSEIKEHFLTNQEIKKTSFSEIQTTEYDKSEKFRSISEIPATLPTKFGEKDTTVLITKYSGVEPKITTESREENFPEKSKQEELQTTVINEKIFTGQEVEYLSEVPKTALTKEFPGKEEDTATTHLNIINTYTNKIDQFQKLTTVTGTTNLEQIDNDLEYLCNPCPSSKMKIRVKSVATTAPTTFSTKATTQRKSIEDKYTPKLTNDISFLCDPCPSRIKKVKIKNKTSPLAIPKTTTHLIEREETLKIRSQDLIFLCDPCPNPAFKKKAKAYTKIRPEKKTSFPKITNLTTIILKESKTSKELITPSETTTELQKSDRVTKILTNSLKEAANYSLMPDKPIGKEELTQTMEDVDYTFRTKIKNVLTCTAYKKIAAAAEESKSKPIEIFNNQGSKSFTTEIFSQFGNITLDEDHLKQIFEGQTFVNIETPPLEFSTLSMTSYISRKTNIEGKKFKNIESQKSASTPIIAKNNQGIKTITSKLEKGDKLEETESYDQVENTTQKYNETASKIKYISKETKQTMSIETEQHVSTIESESEESNKNFDKTEENILETSNKEVTKFTQRMKTPELNKSTRYRIYLDKTSVYDTSKRNEPESWFEKSKLDKEKLKNINEEAEVILTTNINPSTYSTKYRKGATRKYADWYSEYPEEEDEEWSMLAEQEPTTGATNVMRNKISNEGKESEKDRQNSIKTNQSNTIKPKTGSVKVISETSKYLKTESVTSKIGTEKNLEGTEFIHIISTESPKNAESLKQSESTIKDTFITTNSDEETKILLSPKLATTIRSTHTSRKAPELISNMTFEEEIDKSEKVKSHTLQNSEQQKSSEPRKNETNLKSITIQRPEASENILPFNYSTETRHGETTKEMGKYLNNKETNLEQNTSKNLNTSSFTTEETILLSELFSKLQDLSPSSEKKSEKIHESSEIPTILEDVYETREEESSMKQTKLFNNQELVKTLNSYDTLLSTKITAEEEATKIAEELENLEISKTLRYKGHSTENMGDNGNKTELFTTVNEKKLVKTVAEFLTSEVIVTKENVIASEEVAELENTMASKKEQANISKIYATTESALQRSRISTSQHEMSDRASKIFEGATEYDNKNRASKKYTNEAKYGITKNYTVTESKLFSPSPSYLLNKEDLEHLFEGLNLTRFIEQMPMEHAYKYGTPLNISSNKTIPYLKGANKKNNEIFDEYPADEEEIYINSKEPKYFYSLGGELQSTRYLETSEVFTRKETNNISAASKKSSDTKAMEIAETTLRDYYRKSKIYENTLNKESSQEVTLQEGETLKFNIISATDYEEIKTFNISSFSTPLPTSTKIAKFTNADSSIKQKTNKYSNIVKSDTVTQSNIDKNIVIYSSTNGDIGSTYAINKIEPKLNVLTEETEAINHFKTPFKNITERAEDVLNTQSLILKYDAETRVTEEPFKVSKSRTVDISYKEENVKISENTTYKNALDTEELESSDSTGKVTAVTEPAVPEIESQSTLCELCDFEKTDTTQPKNKMSGDSKESRTAANMASNVESEVSADETSAAETLTTTLEANNVESETTTIHETSAEESLDTTLEASNAESTVTTLEADNVESETTTSFEASGADDLDNTLKANNIESDATTHESSTVESLATTLGASKAENIATSSEANSVGNEDTIQKPSTADSLATTLESSDVDSTANTLEANNVESGGTVQKASTAESLASTIEANNAENETVTAETAATTVKASVLENEATSVRQSSQEIVSKEETDKFTASEVGSENFDESSNTGSTSGPSNTENGHNESITTGDDTDEIGSREDVDTTTEGETEKLSSEKDEDAMDTVSNKAGDSTLNEGKESMASNNESNETTSSEAGIKESDENNGEQSNTSSSKLGSTENISESTEEDGTTESTISSNETGAVGPDNNTQKISTYELGKTTVVENGNIETTETSKTEEESTQVPSDKEGISSISTASMNEKTETYDMVSQESSPKPKVKSDSHTNVTSATSILGKIEGFSISNIGMTAPHKNTTKESNTNLEKSSMHKKHKHVKTQNLEQTSTIQIDVGMVGFQSTPCRYCHTTTERQISKVKMSTGNTETTLVTPEKLETNIKNTQPTSEGTIFKENTSKEEKDTDKEINSEKEENKTEEIDRQGEEKTVGDEEGPEEGEEEEKSGNEQTEGEGKEEEKSGNAQTEGEGKKEEINTDKEEEKTTNKQLDNGEEIKTDNEQGDQEEEEKNTIVDVEATTKEEKEAEEQLESTSLKEDLSEVDTQKGGITEEIADNKIEEETKAEEQLKSTSLKEELSEVDTQKGDITEEIVDTKIEEETKAEKQLESTSLKEELSEVDTQKGDITKEIADTKTEGETEAKEQLETTSLREELSELNTQEGVITGEITDTSVSKKKIPKPIVIIINNSHDKLSKLNQSVLEGIISTQINDVDLHYIDVNVGQIENSNLIIKNQPLKLSVPYESCKKADYINGENCFCNIQIYMDLLLQKINNKENIKSKKNYCESFLKLNSGLLIQNSIKPIERKRRGLIYLENLKKKGETVEYETIDGLFEDEYQLNTSAVNLFCLPGEIVKIRCTTSKDEKGISWKFRPLSSLKDELLLDKGGELVIHGVSAKNTGNYTCSKEDDKSVLENQHWHELEMITFPVYDINMNIFYKFNDSCSLRTSDILHTYLPKIVGPLLCSNENDLCSVDVKRPRCLTRADDNYYNVTMTAKISSDFVSTLHDKCDINCKLRIYENLVTVIYKNTEILEHVPVYSMLEPLRKIEFFPNINGKEGSPVSVKRPKIMVSCPSGFGLESKHQSVCVACPPHTFSGDDEAFCKTCPAGKYQPEPGSKSCIQCNSPVDNEMCLRMLYTDTKLFKIYVGVAFGFIVLMVIIVLVWTSGQKDNNAQTKSSYFEGSLRHRAMKKKDPDIETGIREPLLGRSPRRSTPPQLPPVDF